MKTFLMILLLIITAKVFALQPKFILFYSSNCPHCLDVQEFIKQNRIENKIAIEQKEIISNLSNQRELIGILKKCRMPSDSVQLPLLWTGNRCLVGEDDIEKFFSKRDR